MEHLIELKDVYKIYQMGEETVHALDGIDLTIDEGEFVAIVGQSGSGKSTAMNIIGCLDVPTAGTYHLGGIDVSTMEDDQQAEIRNKMLGFIFQQYNLIPKLNVQENVELPLLYAGVSAEERHDRALQALERVGLSDKRKNLPSQLSGGQQQRVSIARALAGDPSVILADEPTGALDSHTGREVLNFLQNLNAEGNTVVLITHDNSIAVKAKRIVRLQDGKIIYDGDSQDPRAVVQPEETGAPAPDTGFTEPVREGGGDMNFAQSFRLAVKSLRTSKMRSLLTMLGIIIGVAAVIIITSLGNGMQNYMNTKFEEMGSNLINVQVMDAGTSRSVDADDMYALVAKYPQYLSGVTPYDSVKPLVRKGTDEFDRTSVYGVSEYFYSPDKGTTMMGSSLSKGRFLTYVDVERVQSVCVIGAYLEAEAFQGDALGKTITLSGAPFTVVGVLKEKADLAAGSGDDVIYIPHTQADRLSTASSYATLYLFTSTGRDTAAAGKGIVEGRLFKTYQDTDYYFVMTSAEMMDSMDSMLNLLMAILTLIAAISLLVGGIGIMNIMLVSVTERTREIGVRKSLGAKRRDIRSQFIIEAGTTSAIGGVIGIILGVIMANVISNVIALRLGTGNDGFVAIPTLSGIAVAFGVSVLIGVLFGYLPANKAAKLNPIDALRYD